MGHGLHTHHVLCDCGHNTSLPEEHAAPSHTTHNQNVWLAYSVVNSVDRSGVVTLNTNAEGALRGGFGTNSRVAPLRLRLPLGSSVRCSSTSVLCGLEPKYTSCWRASSTTQYLRAQGTQNTRVQHGCPGMSTVCSLRTSVSNSCHWGRTCASSPPETVGSPPLSKPRALAIGVSCPIDDRGGHMQHQRTLCSLKASNLRILALRSTTFWGGLLLLLRPFLRGLGSGRHGATALTSTQ